MLFVPNSFSHAKIFRTLTEILNCKLQFSCETISINQTSYELSQMKKNFFQTKKNLTANTKRKETDNESNNKKTR